MNDKYVRRALWAKLNGEGSVTSLLSAPAAIYAEVAPPSANFPLIVFSKSAGTPRYAFQARAFDTQVWLVKAVTRDGSADAGEDIAAAVDAALTNAVLTITDGTLLDLRRESDVAYAETEGDRLYRHRGAYFRLIAT